MKKTKFFAYYTFGVIIYCIFFMFNKDLHVAFRYVGYGLLGIEAIFVLILIGAFVKASNENNKFRLMLNNNEFDPLEKILKEKIEKCQNPIRMDLYYYDLILCYLYQDKDGDANLIYEKITSKTYYPIIHYYKAAIEFYNGCYTNLDNLYEEFKSSYETIKNPNTYKDFDCLFRAMISYHNDDGKLSEILKEIDLEKFTLGCSTRAIKKLKG